MPDRPVKIIMFDMLDAIDGIQDFIAGMTEIEYQKDAKTRAAVERYLEILGEAANKFPGDFYVKNAHIEWHKIIALRNRIIHAYFDVNNKIVWQVASEYLPKLRAELDSIVKSL